MKLVPLPEFRRDYYGGRAPDPRTLRARIRRGQLPGARHGRLYYVDVDALERRRAPTGNALADKVLADEP